MYDVRQAIKDMRVNIKDCIGILREYQDKDFGIDTATINYNENPYTMLMEHFLVSLYYVDELGDWLNRGAPDQR